MSQLVEIFVKYKQAEIEAAEEYRTDKTWHVDMCNCTRCQALQQWIELPWHKRLIAKLRAFVTYGTC